LREYKEKQAEILSQMQDHSDADETFYLTANATLNIAKRAKEIFVSSEVMEKRQLLGFLLQNCVLNGKKLEFTMRSPYNLMVQNHDDITLREWLDAFRTVNWKEVKQELQFIPSEYMNKLQLFKTTI
jgi:hypothetical protein